MAIDTRIHRATKTVRWRLDKRNYVVGKVDYPQNHTKSVSCLFSSGHIEKRRRKAYCLDLRSGALQHLDSQLAIKPSAHKTQSAATGHNQKIRFLESTKNIAPMTIESSTEAHMTSKNAEGWPCIGNLTFMP